MKVAIIGAGASGIISAITLAKNKIDVVVFEKEKTIGKKLKITGNGKGNLSNLSISRKNYNSDFTQEIIKRFDFPQLEKLFNEEGIFLKSDSEGRVYPICEKATQVLEILRINAINYGVKFILDTKIDFEKIQIDPLIINGEFFDKVFIATGGKSTPETGSDGSGLEILRSLGHTIIEPKSGLCPLEVLENIKELAGVRVKAEIIYKNFRQKGEILFKETSLSGIVVFSLSREFRTSKTDTIMIDLFPTLEKRQLHSFINKIITNQPWKYVDCLLDGLIDKKLGLYILNKALKYKGMLLKDLNNEQITAIVTLLKELTLTVFNADNFAFSQVTMGGISINEINSNFQSKLYRNLYILGEVLDIDGDTGGYNLHMAFASGYLAAMDVIKC